jgi:4-hydroxybenzoate polyprenyltransferase
MSPGTRQRPYLTCGTLTKRFGVLLVLGRVSNLPTVWSNCLAAWLLSGAGPWPRFFFLTLGATLLYTAGMFLNDAFDADFDRQYRPERPIPSGLISPRTVWVVGCSLLLLSWLALVPLGTTTILFGASLAGLIVLYDAIHKHTIFAPIFMAGCRFLLYLLAGCSADTGFSSALLLCALALAAYITGISYLARGESLQGAAPLWSVALLFVPSITAVAFRSTAQILVIPVLALEVGWILWCLRGPWLHPKRPISHGVAGLLAGIVLVDSLAAVNLAAYRVAFLGLFVLALLLQRLAPAT